MSDDPFAEPSDAERTIIRPRIAGVVGGRRGSPTAPRTRSGTGELRPIPKTGTNPLTAAASTVLAAAVRITSDLGRSRDVDQLHRAMVAAVRRFQTEALATGLDTRSLRAARYALCATVDDLVLSTPWGSTSSWAQQSMTSVFHNEVTGGERFFEILDQMQQDLGHHEPVVELMYLCLSLGFSGRYRVMPQGDAALADLRDGIYRTVRQRRGDFERELSPSWRGIDAGARALSRRIPLWALGLGTAALAAGMFVSWTFLLADASDIAFAELLALPPHGEAAVPRQPAAGSPAASPSPVARSPVARSGAFGRLSQLLAPEIEVFSLIQIFEDPQTVTVRLTNRNMFASGTASLAGSFLQLIGRIGDALNGEAGDLRVFGFTDDQPIRTPRFPSNFELSQARADAVAAMLRTRLNDPKRLSSQGKGSADPIASNANPEGRQQNRRTEIVLVRASDAL